MKCRTATPQEELVNVVTHGLGLLASLAILPLLIGQALRLGDLTSIIGVSVFGATLVGVYAASTMYHAVPAGPRKEYWRCVDQSAVYLLIAGTYTPFMLGGLG